MSNNRDDIPVSTRWFSQVFSRTREYAWRDDRFDGLPCCLFVLLLALLGYRDSVATYVIIRFAFKIWNKHSRTQEKTVNALFKASEASVAAGVTHVIKI